MSIKNLILGAAVASIGLMSSQTAEAGNSAYLGEMFIMPYTFCPRGTISAEGQLLPINQYSALFSLLGTQYGGDGRTSFAVPDLRGRIALGQGSGAGLSPKRNGERGGSETSIIVQSNIPSHTHRVGIQTYDDPANSTTPKGNAFGISADNTYVSNETSPSGKFMNSLSVTMDSSGGNSSEMTNMQPSLVLRTCIAVTGTFPSRN